MQQHQSTWAVPALMAGVLVTLGCTEATRPTPPPPPPPTPTILGVSAALSPVMTVAARVDARAIMYDSAYVRFWAGGGPVRETPRYAFNGDSVVAIPVLDLDTTTSYSLETNFILNGQATVPADTSVVTTGSLPAWIPMAVPQGPNPDPGYLVLSYPDGPVVMDNAGRVVWYLFAPNGALNSFQAQPRGRYTRSVAQATDPPFEVYDALGQKVDELHCANGRDTRFHDFLLLAAGDYWIMCNEFRTMDLSGVGGDPASNVFATVVQHVAADGTLLFEWNAFDHFQITDLDPINFNSPNVNFTHGNALELDTDGNLLVSFRSLNEVTKIDVATGSVLWRFGGLANQFTLVGDTVGNFQRQHGVRVVAPNEIQFLDNRENAPSRMVRYRIDTNAMTATLVWEFYDSPTTHTFVGGSTQVLAGGGGLVSFGRAGRVVEVDDAGSRAWELTGIDSLYVFRAQRISSLYTPGRGDPTR
jgi:hypothetical protein